MDEMGQLSPTDKAEIHQLRVEALIKRINHDFKYHPPTDDSIKLRHEQVRGILKDTAQVLVAWTTPSRELSLALTSLEEAMFWANAAIARHQEELCTPQHLPKQ